MAKKKHSADPSKSKLFGVGIIAGEAAASKLRQRLAKQLRFITEPLQYRELLTLARQELDKFAPLYAQILLDSQLAAWVYGLNAITKQTPSWALEIINYGVVNPLKIDKLSPRDKVFANVLTGSIKPAPSPKIVFPALGEMLARMINKKAVRKKAFEKLTPEVATRSFTVAYLNTQKKVEEVKELVVRSITEQKTLPQFRKDVVNTLGSGVLSPWHVETVFRTNMQKAFAEGQESVINQPLVQNMFPYAAFYAIHDSRVRDNHIALESLGLNGTNIYRADDPMWEFFTPPIEWNCRCSKKFLNLRQAAQRGVEEAKTWLSTGVPPENPEYRLPAINFRPDPTYKRILVKAEAA